MTIYGQTDDAELMVVNPACTGMATAGEKNKQEYCLANGSCGGVLLRQSHQSINPDSNVRQQYCIVRLTAISVISNKIAREIPRSFFHRLQKTLTKKNALYIINLSK